MNTKLEKFYTDQDLLRFYGKLVEPRLIEERMLKLLRQNKIAKWFSGIGQEAIAVGVTSAIEETDYLLPMHRNLGVFTSRNVDLYKLFCQLFGKKDGFTGGRERSFHFGVMEHHIIGMISHLSAMLPVADGLALASKLSHKKNISIAFTGDGATSEGDFHEAVNLAAVWKLPVIFVIENNGYGLSTPINEQFACENLAEKGIGYGIESHILDGNDFFEVYETIKKLRVSVSENPRPILVEMKTFRMRGHEEASGTAYVPPELFEIWEKKDPIKRFEEQVLKESKITKKQLAAKKEEIHQIVDTAIEAALQCENPDVQSTLLVEKVLKPFNTVEKSPSPELISRRFVDAVTAGLSKAFDEDEKVLIMGQDVAEYGGVFKVTQGFADKYGKERVRNTPIIESGAIGAAYGLALAGFKPVVEMQFADFISCGFNQIINNLAKSHFRWSDGINVTIRAPHGAGVSAGPFHSQSPEAWFMQHPGLKVLVPSSVEDAQNFIYTAIQDPNPVLVFEHKKLYRSLKSEVSSEAHLVDYHKAKFVSEGNEALIISYGMGIHWAMDLLEKENLNGKVAILDLRCLNPIDFDTILGAVKQCSRVLLLEEHGGYLGPMSEIAKFIAEFGFEYLDAPLITCSSLACPIPTNPVLEQEYLATRRLEIDLKKLLAY